MPLTVTQSSGDGVLTNQVRFSLELPDTGSLVSIAGQVIAAGSVNTAGQKIAGAVVLMTGSPVTAPAAPGSGSIFYVIQVNLTTGALSMKQSTVAMPTADAGNFVLFQQTLVSGNTNLALVASTTLDTF